MVEGIVGGIIGGLGHALLTVPWQVWLALMIVVVIAIALLRLVTDPHISIPVIVIAAMVIFALAFRSHFIAEGRAQMQAMVDGYKHTLGLVVNCYDRDPAAHVWDRSQGKCLRRDGAIE